MNGGGGRREGVVVLDLHVCVFLPLWLLLLLHVC